MPQDSSRRCILVTGGAGFMGSAFVRRLVAGDQHLVVNLDKLTYAGHLESVPPSDGERHVFVQGDIGDVALVSELLARYRPEAIVNFAAESHVDRSIDRPATFVETNVLATARLLDCATSHWRELSSAEKERFRFVHISTDEVYGSLGPDRAFREGDPYRPNSPYAASKAAGDMFMRAYHATYGTPVVVAHCSNNYGPRQFPEKLLPLVILNALEGKPLPVYGDGSHVRDWLYVEDTCEALELLLLQGRVGQAYNVGGSCERTNLDLVRQACRTIDRLCPELPHLPTEQLITLVDDRPGHDRRYALDSAKLTAETGWRPRHDLDAGLEQTVAWYLDNGDWVSQVCAGIYRRERLGLGVPHVELGRPSP